MIETVEEDGQVLIVNVAVAPRFQRQGFGRTLLAHAERLAKDLGKGHVRRYTNPRFIQNIRLYKRLGYTIDREEDFGVAIAVHMSKAVHGKGA